MAAQVIHGAFDHPDPIHNAPTDEEMAWMPIWDSLNKKQRFVLVNMGCGTGVGDVHEFIS